jgi:PPOX class probable FMN-dependent enzyme
MSVSASDRAWSHVVASLDELEGIYDAPEEGAAKKAIDHLDVHCHEFIVRSPFVLLSTAGLDGRCDVSPRGGPAGFVEVVDARRLIIPDASGNRRVDSLRNIVATGHAGLLFLIPGLEETLRVNGRAELTRDPEVLARHVTKGKTPRIAIGVEVEEAFLHCAKAFKRSSLWQPEQWPELDGLARPAQIWHDHMHLESLSVEAIQDWVDDDYANKLY